MAVSVGSTLYLSGIGPADASAPIEDQTASALDRLSDVLDEAGLDDSNVVSCHVHLANMDNYAAMNGIYGSHFSSGSYPARTTVEVPGLPDGAGILLMCIAFSDEAEIEVVRPPESEIPAPMGPYSPAVRAGETIYVSGQGGRDPKTGEIAASAGDQARQTLTNISTILRAAGLRPFHAVQALCYFPPSATAAELDEAFSTAFDPGGAPSRTNIPLSRLPGDIQAEITFIAVRDDYLTRLFTHDQPPAATSSPASISGGVAYISATAGAGETFREQFLDALGKQAAALRLAHMDLPNTARATLYLSDLGDLAELHTLINEAFPDGAPAVTAYQTHLPPDSLVALDVIAVK